MTTNYIYFHKGLFEGREEEITENVTDDYNDDLDNKYYRLTLEQQVMKMQFPWVSFDEVISGYLNDDHVNMLNERKRRAFESRSDGKFVAYQRYLAIGDTVKADKAYNEWIEAANLVEQDFSYIDMYVRPELPDDSSDDK